MPVMTPRYPFSHIFGKSSHSPVSGHAPLNALPADEFLAVAKVVIVVGCVVVVCIIVVAEAPIAASEAGAIWLYGYAN